MEIDGGSYHNFAVLVNSVHAIMLEMGFVVFDSESAMEVDRISLPDESPSMNSRAMSFRYTLAQLLANRVDESSEIKSAVLHFLNLGKFVDVYGSLSVRKSVIYQVSLDLNENRDSYELLVKNGIGLPLLTDICEKTGLPSPLSFMAIPDHVKLRIFESFDAEDVVKIGCTCSQLRDLTLDRMLWHRKFVKEFGSEAIQGMIYSKEQYVLQWKSQKEKMRNESSLMRALPMFVEEFFYNFL